MVLTVDEATRHIMDTLATDQLPNVGAFRILNDAGEYLCTTHDWAWLLGRRTLLHFEKDQGHVWLPMDFRDLVAYDASGFTNTFILGTLQEIVDIRTKAISGTNWPYRGVIVYAPRAEFPTGTLVFTGTPADAGTLKIDDGVNVAVTFEFDTSADGVTSGNIEVDNSASGITAATTANLTQAQIEDQFTKGNLDINAVVDTTATGTVNLKNRRVGTVGNISITDSATNVTVTGMSGGLDTGRPQARIDLSTDPSADLEDALTIYYRAGWTHLNEDDDLVAIPEWLETLYLQLVRAHARGYHREDMGTVTERVAAVSAGPHMLAAIDRDNSMQPDFGLQRGGAIGLHSRADIFWNFDSVAGPV